MQQQSHQHASQTMAFGALGAACAAAVGVLFAIGRGPDVQEVLYLGVASAGAAFTVGAFWLHGKESRADSRYAVEGRAIAPDVMDLGHDLPVVIRFPRSLPGDPDRIVALFPNRVDWRSSRSPNWLVAKMLLHHANTEPYGIDRVVVGAVDAGIRRDLEEIARQLERPYMLVDPQSWSDRRKINDSRLSNRTWLIVDAEELASATLEPIILQASQVRSRVIILGRHGDSRLAQSVPLDFYKRGLLWSLVFSDMIEIRGGSVPESSGVSRTRTGPPETKRPQRRGARRGVR